MKIYQLMILIILLVATVASRIRHKRHLKHRNRHRNIKGDSLKKIYNNMKDYISDKEYEAVDVIVYPKLNLSSKDEKLIHTKFDLNLGKASLLYFHQKENYSEIELIVNDRDTGVKMYFHYENKKYTKPYFSYNKDEKTEKKIYRTKLTQDEFKNLNLNKGLNNIKYKAKYNEWHRATGRYDFYGSIYYYTPDLNYIAYYIDRDSSTNFLKNKATLFRNLRSFGYQIIYLTSESLLNIRELQKEYFLDKHDTIWNPEMDIARNNEFYNAAFPVGPIVTDFAHPDVTNGKIEEKEIRNKLKAFFKIVPKYKFNACFSTSEYAPILSKYIPNTITLQKEDKLKFDLRKIIVDMKTFNKNFVKCSQSLLIERKECILYITNPEKHLIEETESNENPTLSVESR